jgi:hypothetical protein
MTPHEWMTLIEDRAIRLRAAGVTSIRINGDSVTVGFAPFEAKPAKFPADSIPDRPAAAEDRVELDPLDDPMTFGGMLPNLHPAADERTENPE